MAISKLLLATLASSASAVKLYVTSYAPEGSPNGAISTLEFTPGVGGAALKPISTNQECGSAPTWLDKSIGGGRIVCVDEGWGTPLASLNTLTISADGSLKRTAKLDIIQGPVSTQFYNNNSAVALAHYGGAAISNYKLNGDGSFTALQNFTFKNPPGPRPEQESSHVHHSVIDPSGKFIIFPDLGSDVVRVYSIDSNTALLKEQESLKTPAGAGPRHAAFWQPRKAYGRASATYLFVIYELANKVVSYKVSYPKNGSLTFSQVDEQGLYGDRADPVGTRAAEISVSPDNRFVIGSNRNATIFKVDNPDPKNSTKIPSDSLVTFEPKNDGTLEFVQLAPSGGSFPRHFALNKDGSLIAVGNQNSRSVEVFSRNVQSGKIGARVATAQGLPGAVNNIVWE